jgi:hypothetical protein
MQLGVGVSAATVHRPPPHREPAPLVLLWALLLLTTASLPLFSSLTSDIQEVQHTETGELSCFLQKKSRFYSR